MGFAVHRAQTEIPLKEISRLTRRPSSILNLLPPRFRLPGALLLVLDGHLLIEEGITLTISLSIHCCNSGHQISAFIFFGGGGGGGGGG